MLDDARLVWDLQRATQIAQGFSSSLDQEDIARIATEGLIEQFNCAFARIWLIEPDRKLLRLVASSGLYTRTDGSFSRIPMGELKIGKIAQNRVALLSNHLAEESWIRYPEWAIANDITSFAGYPLANADKVIGVLAVFGHHPMGAEFLEVLLGFCTTLTVALEMASLHQKETHPSPVTIPANTLTEFSLSDSLAQILGSIKLTVLGTERALDLSQTQLFLKVAEILKTLDCTYCRLAYDIKSVALEAIVTTTSLMYQEQQAWEALVFGNLTSIATYFGGSLKINAETSINALHISLAFPAVVSLPEVSLNIQCRLPLLQTGFTQLAHLAGITVQMTQERHIPLLTDQVDLVGSCDRIIWLHHNANIRPDGVNAQVTLSTTANQLRVAVEAVIKGEEWGLGNKGSQPQLRLSNREQEVIGLLTQGFRDRDIAEQLHISDSTVKFHINNILAKVKAKTRLQALYQLINTHGLNL
ncbi:GAF domain-containing protein [Leptolyngbyaceae cyanobacterium CCMR0082]|uniref:GAF domain-containing protein n=1 Tax=Adonisia turfae CCMR0082 TaxID=2304604 RepID=A0A6M0S7S6_9CYAN|nr:LuxR C-terminal-related transcriptional regulator [Adonisia turfae]NEZ64133.1 GAF domain-containing protein [Adonisia turfae CCMR0082]